MEDLKHLMDTKNLTEIYRELHQFIHSADGCENRLKMVFALMYLVSEADGLIRTVDMDGLISDIRERIGEVDSQVEKLGTEYHSHLAQNDVVAQYLADSSNNSFEQKQRQIAALLDEYDAAIKALVEIREKMSIEQQIAAEKQNNANA